MRRILLAPTALFLGLTVESAATIIVYDVAPDSNIVYVSGGWNFGDGVQFNFEGPDPLNGYLAFGWGDNIFLSAQQGPVISPIAFGSIIGAQTQFEHIGGYFPTSGTSYIGLKYIFEYQLPDSSVGFSTHYGWIELLGDGMSSPLVTRYAINNIAGQSVLAGYSSGVVPEPSTFAATAGVLALVALTGLRRRKVEPSAR